MAGASANRRLIKKQYKDEHGSRDEKRLNFARSRTVTGLRHVGGDNNTWPSAYSAKKNLVGEC